MKLGFPQFEKIKDFSSFEKQLQTFSTNYDVGKFKLGSTAQTLDNYFKTEKTIVLARGSLRQIQTSFDKDFLLQHLAAFDFKIQVYIEQMMGGNTYGKNPLLRQDIFPKKMITFDDTKHLQEYFSSESCQISGQQKQMFIEELRSEEKLYDFLSSICLRSCDQVANEIILIASEICYHHSLIRHFQYNYQKLLQQSKNLAESLTPKVKNHPHIKYLTFDSTLVKPVLHAQQRDQETKKIVQFLILTIFLILSHQFVNPFYQQKISSQLKRHQFFNNYTHHDSYQDFSENQDEDEIELLSQGRKRIK